MSDLRGFNANTVEPLDDFEAIPAGKYQAVITESETKATKNGNGSYLQLTFQIIDGEFKNRKVWARLNLDNPNDLAVKIARAELAAICKAVNVLEPKDSCELHNLPLIITVKQKTDDDGEVRNEVKGYAKRNGTPPTQSSKPAAVSGSAPPWRR